MKVSVFFLVLLCLAVPAVSFSYPFRKHILNQESTYSACGVSDIDLDGDLDVICGGWWYEAPDWQKHFVRKVEEIRGRFDGYSHLPLDMDGDGDEDFININYRSESIYWVERPDDLAKPWQKHLIALPGAMETGILCDVDGDGRKDILPNGAKFAAWWRGSQEESSGRITFSKIDLPAELAGHGLGFGDIDGDGRSDQVGVNGWAKAPEDRLKGNWEWKNQFFLEERAGIPVQVQDVDGDGDADLVWSSAHDYGVFWMEQLAEGKWRKHEIDISWSQGHTPLWADLDGNGVGELVSGKRYLAHEGKDPGAMDPLVIYSYEYRKSSGEWLRREISRDDGVGWGLDPKIADIDSDGDLDLICPGRSGLYLLENLRIQ